MTSITTKLESSQPAAETAVYLFDHWFDPIEAGLRDRVREFIHAMIEGELDMALSRPRYARHAKPSSGQAAGAVDSLEEAGARLFTFTAAEPMAKRADYKCDRTAARGVQTKDQDPDRAAVCRHRCHAVLGAACLRPNQHAQGRWLADTRHKAH